MLTQSLLNELMSQATQKRNIYGAVMCVEKGDDFLSLVSGAGNIQAEDPYFIASVTKLYITAILLRLQSEQHLQLEDKISKYLCSEIISGIHVLHGIDYSNDITIHHLLSNTSGIPDYFSSDVVTELINGKDQSWHFEKSIEAVKLKKPKFKPGQKGKAQYSDTNFQLLGAIIENITKKKIQSVFKAFVIDELHLEETYVFEDVDDTKPVPIYYKSKQLLLPVFMSSIPAEGGIVSTARDSMIFLRAFFNGHFFPKKDLLDLQRWNLLFGPGLFYYGVGISRQPLSPFEMKKGLIGHWGQSGAFAFHHPETDLYFTGTINQYTGHSVAVKVMMKIIKLYKDK